MKKSWKIVLPIAGVTCTAAPLMVLASCNSSNDQSEGHFAQTELELAFSTQVTTELDTPYLAFRFQLQNMDWKNFIYTFKIGAAGSDRTWSGDLDDYMQAGGAGWHLSTSPGMNTVIFFATLQEKSWGQWPVNGWIQCKGKITIADRATNKATEEEFTIKAINTSAN